MQMKMVLVALSLVLSGCQEEEFEGTCAERLFQVLSKPEYTKKETTRFSGITQTILQIVESPSLNACDFSLLNGRLVNRYGQPVDIEWKLD